MTRKINYENKYKNVVYIHTTTKKTTEMEDV